MSTTWDFNFISFKSRQHTIYFSQLLERAGYKCQIISTPKGVSLGCGLSVSFSPHLTGPVIELYKHNQVPIIGFYSIKHIGNYAQLYRIPID